MDRNKAIEKLELLKELEKRKAKKDILAFTKYTMSEYIDNWHHREYAKKLNDFMSGKIKNLMVFMPPQHGKSELSTRRVPSKMLGDNPNLKIGLAAYNHTIAAKFNRDIQRIISSDKYKNMYPETRLKKDSTDNGSVQNNDEFDIVNKKGSLVSVGIGGSLTSRQIDVAIMDDLYKDAQTAWSSTVRENVQEWYDTVLRTRLHNDSQQLLVFTRWHEEDLAGYLLRTEPENWDVVLFEAIKTSTKNKTDKRKVGEALWDERHSLETLEKIKKNNPIVFESLYQQNPTPKEGLLLAESELNRFKLSDLKDKQQDGILSTIDIADEGTDRLCQIIAFIYGNKAYIVDVAFTQEPIEVTQPIVASMLDKYNVQKAIFESNNGGKGYAMKVKEIKNGTTTVQWKPTTANKHTKIIMASGNIKENFYFRSDIENHAEYKEYLYELTHYPKNGKIKHDDAIDTTAMLENNLKKQGVSFLK